jgi:ATP-dependent DNA helicase 2 subunit 2
MQETYNPFINRINQVVQHRLLHPNDDIPEPYEVLIRYMNPPEELVESAQSELDSLISAADVKKGMKVQILTRNCLIKVY